jgi:hypothetical protein
VKEIQDSSNREIDRLEGEVNNLSRPARGANSNQALLNGIAAFMLQAEDLERRCIVERGSPAIEKEALDFYNRVAKFLSDELGLDYAARFKTAMGNGVALNYPLDKTALLGRIRGRKAFLGEVLKELRSR